MKFPSRILKSKERSGNLSFLRSFHQNLYQSFTKATSKSQTNKKNLSVTFRPSLLLIRPYHRPLVAKLVQKYLNHQLRSASDFGWVQWKREMLSLFNFLRQRMRNWIKNHRRNDLKKIRESADHGHCRTAFDAPQGCHMIAFLILSLGVS